MCGEDAVAGIVHRALVTGGAATNTLTNADEFNIFAMILVKKLKGVEKTKWEFENQ